LRGLLTITNEYCSLTFIRGSGGGGGSMLS
jgi:hypothetical protein